MSGPQEMHIIFRHRGTNYNIDLVRGKPSDHSVEINGVAYAVLGDEEKLETACKILASVSLDSITNEKDLQGRLSRLEDISFPQAQKTDRVGIDVWQTSVKKPKKIEEAYQKLFNDLEVYAKKHLGEGAILVQVIGVPGSEPILFGKRSVNDPEPILVRDDMVGRTGSGCKLWTALLTKIITTKYDKYIKMDDGLGKFAHHDALKKFGVIGPDGKDIQKPEWAREISVESFIAMTAGLEYEDQAPDLTKTTEKTLDQVMRGVDIKPGSIHMLFHPRDKIYEYSNNVCLTAYPIEKAYKKVLAEENIPKDAKVGDTRKAKELGLSEEVQKLSLDELLKCDDAYIKDAYVYDLLDLFLSDLEPPLDNFTYEKILQKELLGPMGMEKSGFYKKYESPEEAKEAMDLTFFDKDTKKDKSKPLTPEHPMVHGMSFGRTTLRDATKLAEKLASGEGLVAENGRTLLNEDDLKSVFTSHSHYEPFGLGAIELSCGNQVIDKGGWVNQDQYSFWVDRESHVGLIAMCNCGRRPDDILAEFKASVEKIYHDPDATKVIKEKENKPLGIPIENFFTHPLVRDKVTMCFEGSRGRVALLFDFKEAQIGQKGLIHWSGAPLEVKKLDEVNFCITTPGRFKDINVRIVKGDFTKDNYLAIGFDAFYEIKKDEIDLVLPSDRDIIDAQNEFKNMAGVYYSKEGEHDALIFKIKKDNKGGILLCAGEKGRDLIPQSIIKVEKNAISFNGHDRQPPDKIFHFVRDVEGGPWRLQVLDYASKKFIEERIDVQSAKKAYLLATENPHDSHVAVGILRPDGSISELNLGKNESYGAHRIGSVTKTFTTFLALKLMNDGMINLETSLGDLIDKRLIAERVLQGIFADPEKARQMTLEQLLSHTSGLQLEDKPRIGPDGTEDPNVRLSTLNERFTYQATLDEKYEHKHEPGEGVGLYSNIGFDVAAWMLELVYNADKGYKTPQIPFSQIMRDELFTKVFKLSEDTRISPGFTGDGDVIQAGCGDMVSSVSDLLKVAQALQKGEEHLSSHFGEEWQKKMLEARGSDAKYTYGLGCEANASSIQFSGLNYELFEDGIERDVTAHVAFPLRPNQPGIVAMTDSNALGPLENQVKFREELRKLAGLSVKKPETIEEAYTILAEDLGKYAKENLKEGALLIQVVGIEGAEKPLVFGKRSVKDVEPVSVNENTIGRTGSGAKLWAGLLTNILTSKYDQYIQMDDGLGRFAPEEALRKFGKMEQDGIDKADVELAKEISVEGLVGMMAGLEYEQPSPKDPPLSSLDQFLRGPEIKDGSIHILYHPRDNINLYTNNICFAAYPIEKAYKKVLAAELIEQGKLKETDTLRALSPKLDKFRKELEEKIEDLEQKGRFLGPFDIRYPDVKHPDLEIYETRLAYLKADLQKLTIPDAALGLTLKELMDCKSAYTGPPSSIYIYDALDLFLMPSNNHQVDYAEIMKRELLGPIGMDNSGFHDIPGIHMDVTFENDKTKQDESYTLPKEHPMRYAAGFGRTSLSDASQLAKGLADPRGLVRKDNEQPLLTREQLDAFFKPHGHYAGWGLGGAELTCEDNVIDKGGSLNQDQYSFWVDRKSGVGMIAMCNCGRRPDEILNAFKENVENINYPGKHIAKEKEGTPIGIAIDHYFAHPLVLEDVHQLFEGTRGRIALLFDYNTAEKGVIHWSGTPLEVKKKKDGTFRVTTPGRFQGLVIEKIRGEKSGEDYLAVGDTSFIAIKTENLPSQKDIEKAEKEYSQFRGKYINEKHLEWGVLEFEVLKDGEGNILLGARDGSKGDFVPQSIVKADTNSILFNGHDRQPPDKIFKFIRESENEPWRLQVLDYISKKFIEERPKS